MVRKELMQVELAGVLIAVLLLIFLIYKRLSLIPATLICVAVLALTNGFSYMDLFINHYGVSLAGFVGKYFLVFVTNALFGKVMEETLLASVFSKMIGKLFGDKNAVFGAMLATAILSYGGVSVFVIVFTVYPIFLATFRKADLPGKYLHSVQSIQCADCLGADFCARLVESVFHFCDRSEYRHRDYAGVESKASD